jgi:SAM-dependent methyltransferase
MNEKIVWEKIGNNYANEIFSVLHSDKKGIVKKHISKHIGKNKLAIDFGCGIGYALPFLAPNFKHVIGIDISQKLLDQAAKLKLQNVTLKNGDLTKKQKLPKADFAYCCNVAICDDNKKNYKILNTVVEGLKKGGSAVIVVPSYEASAMAFLEILKMYKKENVKISNVPASELEPKFQTIEHMKNGIVAIEGHPTKHYLVQELYALFKNKKYSIEAIEKIEFGWDSEIADPPKHLKAPYPWDWMIEVKRIK